MYRYERRRIPFQHNKLLLFSLPVAVPGTFLSTYRQEICMPPVCTVPGMPRTVPFCPRIGKKCACHPSDKLLVNWSYPTVTVVHWLMVEKEVIPALIGGTKSEKCCVFKGFTLNKGDNLLICREAYVDGDAINTH
jgi:hypothetical protein